MEDSSVLLQRPNLCFQVSEMENPTNKSLPEELVVEILLKLPAKSLKRFRCVCKSWLSCIESPDFVRNHYRANKITGSNRNALVEGILGNNDSNVYILSNESMLVSKIVEDHVLRFICEECEGVILLFGKSLGLLNPATREFRPIPVSSFERPFYIMTPGLGYDSSNGDCKLIRFVGVHGGLHIELYSLSSNSWRQIDLPDWWDRSVSICHGGLNTYVNGCCHWWFNDGKAILAFDMTREIFHLIDFPFDCVVGLSSQQGYDRTDLRVFNNHLAVFVRSTKSNPFEIWMMEEYGVKESWTKQFEIGPIPRVHDLVGLWKTDEWIFRNTSKRLEIYNSKTKVIEAPVIHNGAFTFGEGRHSFVMFTENLYSLNRHA